MDELYADLIIRGEKVNGEIVTLTRVIESIRIVFSEEKAKTSGDNIKKILIAKGYSKLIK